MEGHKPDCWGGFLCSDGYGHTHNTPALILNDMERWKTRGGASDKDDDGIVIVSLRGGGEHCL